MNERRTVRHPRHALERGDYVLGGEVAAVVELHAAAQLELPGRVVDRLPLARQARAGAAASRPASTRRSKTCVAILMLGEVVEMRVDRGDEVPIPIEISCAAAGAPTPPVAAARPRETTIAAPRRATRSIIAFYLPAPRRRGRPRTDATPLISRQDRRKTPLPQRRKRGAGASRHPAPPRPCRASRSQVAQARQVPKATPR